MQYIATLTFDYYIEAFYALVELPFFFTKTSYASVLDQALVLKLVLSIITGIPVPVEIQIYTRIIIQFFGYRYYNLLSPTSSYHHFRDLLYSVIRAARNSHYLLRRR